MNTTALPPVGYAAPETGTERYFSAAAEPTRPVKSHDYCCPHCNAPHRTTLSKLKSGFIQLAVAVVVIVLSILRLARLIVAGAFTLIGLIGAGFYIAAQYVSHPDDRKLLPKLPLSSSETE